MTRRRIAFLVFAVIAAAAALTAVGRSEGRRELERELEGIARVRAAVGLVGSPTLTAIRPSQGYTCLAYERGDHPAALELCFDGENRLLEASDRRGPTPRVYTLRLDPDAATIVLPAAQVRAAKESVRRALVRSAWTGPVQYLHLCRYLAAGARRSHKEGNPAPAKSAAGSCVLPLHLVYLDAKSARIAGSAPASTASIEFAGILRGYAAELTRLSRDPTQSARRAYDRAVAMLEHRKRAAEARLGEREPWLHISPRLPESSRP